MFVVSNDAAGSIPTTVPGSGGVTVAGAQRNITLMNPPTTAWILRVLCASVYAAGPTNGGSDSCRYSIVPLAPAVQFMFA